MSRPTCTPVFEPTTTTSRSLEAGAPRKLIWVCGSASGVPASGESTTDGADALAAAATPRRTLAANTAATASTPNHAAVRSRRIDTGQLSALSRRSATSTTSFTTRSAGTREPTPPTTTPGRRPHMNRRAKATAIQVELAPLAPTRGNSGRCDSFPPSYAALTRRVRTSRPVAGAAPVSLLRPAGRITSSRGGHGGELALTARRPARDTL